MPNGEFPSQITLPTGETIDIYWNFVGEYDVTELNAIGEEETIRKAIYAPVLHYPQNTRENILSAVNQVYGEDIWREWQIEAGTTFETISTFSQWPAVTDYLQNQGISMEEILGNPQMKSFTLDWVRQGLAQPEAIPGQAQPSPVMPAEDVVTKLKQMQQRQFKAQAISGTVPVFPGESISEKTIQLAETQAEEITRKSEIETAQRRAGQRETRFRPLREEKLREQFEELKRKAQIRPQRITGI